MSQLENHIEDLVPEVSGSKRPVQSINEPSKRQKQNSHVPIIELESDTDTNNQSKSRKNNIEPCGHFMGTDSSTGNFIVHLATHRITEESHKRNVDEMQKKNPLSQPRIDEMIRVITMNNPDIKNRRDRKFVGILVKDNRPISMCNDEGFAEFIHEFDPNYQIPCDKTIQQLLAEAYNQIKTVLTKIFNENILSCSITTDLWTARSRFGYIDVTCSFIDNDFRFCEAILSVQYVSYPHSGDNICRVLREIISN